MELVSLYEFNKPTGLGAEIEANINLSLGEIHLEFYLNQFAGVDLPQGAEQDNEKITRKNELWKKTCFELFFSEVKKMDYYEVNLSPWKEWNAYYFESYRQPTPPVETKLIRPTTINWENNRLVCDLKLSGPLANLQTMLDISLTAVLTKNKGQESHFYAFKHVGEKPDFHLRESFSLKRGMK